MSLTKLIEGQMRNRRCGFSVGGFGALAEYQDDAGKINVASDGKLEAHSARGALRINFTGNESALAYETLSSRADSWQHGLTIFGKLDEFGGACRNVLTELGPDQAALAQHEMGASVFDLGVGLPNVDFCVRTSDSDLIKRLRRQIGNSIFEVEQHVIDDVIDASPSRVVISAIARIEVYQNIERHQTPLGPHTHLLPDLLQKRRTHSANIPLPASNIPLLNLHPDHPLYDQHGRRRPFEAEKLRIFDEWLREYGDKQYWQEKNRVREAIANHTPPSEYVPGETRRARLAKRITLRQIGHDEYTKAQAGLWQRYFAA